MIDQCEHKNLDRDRMICPDCMEMIVPKKLCCYLVEGRFTCGYPVTEVYNPYHGNHPPTQGNYCRIHTCARYGCSGLATKVHGDHRYCKGEFCEVNGCEKFRNELDTRGLYDEDMWKIYRCLEHQSEF
jgi:hypothetical protein